jgi:hypothetical protein
VTARRIRFRAWLLPGLAILLASAAEPAAARQYRSAAAAAETSAQTKLSAVLTAFLVDAGVRTRGLPWTTGAELPVKWETPAAVSADDPYSRQKGLTLTRSGTVTATLGDTVALEASLTLAGNEAGLQRVTVHLPVLLVSRPDGSGFFVHQRMVEQALKDESLTLQPLKCSRETEGASYGNLVDALGAPGKTASGLWWLWQSPMQEPTLTLTILYRRADMTEVECAGG